MTDLVHVKVGEGYEVIFRLASLSLVKKIDKVLFLSLAGEDKPLPIRGPAAAAIWTAVRRSCLTLQTETQTELDEQEGSV